MTAEELLAEAKENVEAIQSELKAGQDWDPHMLMVNAKEERGVVAIEPQFMSEPFMKDLLAEALLPMAISKHEAKAIAFVSSAWILEGIASGTPPDQVPAPRDHPDRQEGVFIEVITQTEYLFSMAKIHRTPDGLPGLGEWQDIGDSAGFTGRFVEPLRQALVGVPPAI